MCGILFALSRQAIVTPDAEHITRLQQRGPDATTTFHHEIDASTNDNVAQRSFLTFTSTVLSLRGLVTIKQPYHETGNDSTLCWNGEAWSVAEIRVAGNDTSQMYKLLTTHASNDVHERLNDLASRLSTVAGPYAFVFYDSASQCVFFGRDFLGRRSLLWRATETGDLLLSSVSIPHSDGAWQEVAADGIYCIDLKHKGSSSSNFGQFDAKRHPYRLRDVTHPHALSSVLPPLSLNKVLAVTSTRLTQHSLPVAALEQHLREAMETRVLNIPDPPIVPARQILPPCRLAILFSGGLDCTVLARLAHDLLPSSEPIDLLNVAFENPRVHKTASPYELCPDRITGRSSFQELLDTYPTRPWRFVAVNIPYTETLAHREIIISLMHPHNTEMDLSISSALYFAARGLGTLSTSKEADGGPYSTTARVLLSGLGADELFAGYTRHATAYRHDGYNGLFKELDLDISRLGTRNLGRDDRIISHWSKEVRFPYLDECLVRWALQVPITDKTGFGEDYDDAAAVDGDASLEPGKKVLRCLAWKLSMTHVAKEKKRAVSGHNENTAYLTQDRYNLVLEQLRWRLERRKAQLCYHD